MTQTLILTGGTGYLGSHLLKKILDQGFRVILLKRSSSETERLSPLLDRVISIDIDHQDLENVFAKYCPWSILHLATQYSCGLEDYSKIVGSNLEFPLKLLNLAKKYGVKSFINIDTSLAWDTSPYALSKKQLVSWLKVFSAPVKCVNIVLENFYGPFEGSNKFVSMVIRAILSGSNHLGLTAGDQSRDFIYIDDVVAAILTLLNQLGEMPQEWNSFEVGSGESVTIKQLVYKIADLTPDCKTRFDFGAVPYRPNEPMETRANLSAILKLGWSPKVSLADGLAETIRLEIDASSKDKL
jgi:CDP-paratose synthetase